MPSRVSSWLRSRIAPDLRVHRRFSSIYPDYRERVLRHEAAHLLAGYLFGVPVTAYSLDLGARAPHNPEMHVCVLHAHGMSVISMEAERM